MVFCSYDGYVIGDGILFYFDCCFNLICFSVNSVDCVSFSVIGECALHFTEWLLDGLVGFLTVFLLRNIWEIMRHGTRDTRFVSLSWIVWSMWKLTYHDCQKIMNLFSLLLSKKVSGAMLLLGRECSGVWSVHVFL